MDSLTDRVVVITGAASGIGLALADRFAREGSKLVLADVEKGALEKAVAALVSAGREAIGVVTDVSRADAVERLADEAVAKFGKIHIVCNNAGVTKHTGEPIWKTTPRDWQWMLDVNLWGVIHGIRTFVPRLISQGEGGHVVNTASASAFIAGGGPYAATKHAVASISESLFQDLRAAGSHIGVSVLAPGLVATRIVDAARNRPNEIAAEPLDACQAAHLKEMETLHARRGLAPSRVARFTVEAVKKRQFYVLTDELVNGLVSGRAERIVAREDPLFFERVRGAKAEP